MRLIDSFHRSAERWPTRTCLIDTTGTRDYRTVREAVWSIAAGLRQRGLAPGTRVAVFGANSSDLMEAVLGVLEAGCVWVPLNARNTATEVVQYLARLEVGVLLHGDGVATALQELPALPGAPSCRLPVDGAARAAWIGEARPADGPLPPLRADTPVSIMSSGGTTGLPKGIVLTELNWAIGSATLDAHYPCDDPVYLVAAPISHAAGGIALMLAGRGPTLVLLPGFDPVAVMQAIQTHRVTHLFLPPTAIYLMLAEPTHRAYDYRSLRHFMYAGAPMSTHKLREAIAAFGPVMTQFYAQMECFASITCLTADDHARALADPALAPRLASAGRPTRYARVAIMDDQGRLLPPGEPGEIVVRSHLVFAGYVGAEVAQTSTDGWHHTGDVGVFDADGYLTIVDRLRDLIISGGFNVYPSEVEQVVLAHPAIRDCAVVGVPDDTWGEAVTAVVELKPGQSVTAEALIAHCRRTLSGVKTPKSVVIVDALPRSPVGKVLRRAVRAPYWQGRSRSV